MEISVQVGCSEGWVGGPGEGVHHADKTGGKNTVTPRALAPAEGEMNLKGQ
jgi:hypothetical protein